MTSRPFNSSGMVPTPTTSSPRAGSTPLRPSDAWRNRRRGASPSKPAATAHERPARGGPRGDGLADCHFPGETTTASPRSCQRAHAVEHRAESAGMPSPPQPSRAARGLLNARFRLWPHKEELFGAARTVSKRPRPVDDVVFVSRNRSALASTLRYFVFNEFVSLVFMSGASFYRLSPQFSRKCPLLFGAIHLVSRR